MRGMEVGGGKVRGTKEIRERESEGGEEKEG